MKGTVEQGNTLVTATIGAGHGLTIGVPTVVNITGALPDETGTGYNGSQTITAISATQFTYSTTNPQTPEQSGNAMVSAGNSTTVRASITGHMFDFFDDASNEVKIIVSGATGATAGAYNTGITGVTATVVDSDTFTYPTIDSSAADPATGTVSVRLLETKTSPSSDSVTFVTLTGHGYSDGNSITIAGADQTDYNNEFVIDVLDTDNFAVFPKLSEIGTATGTMTASIKTTTAKARVVNHGFADGTVVTIDNATPSVFNNAWTITSVDTDNFTFGLTENTVAAQGDATGTISAAAGSGSGTERTNLIEWVRGADNNEDENGDGLTTDVRASIQGDVLHSRPAVVNYNRHGNDDDVYIYYGSNDAIFRAVKGGFAMSDTDEPEPGNEDWSFIPTEFFGKLQRLRNNEPKISSSNKKPYFADSTIGVRAEDNSGPDGATVPDGKLDTTVDNASNEDLVHLFISMRRGGRFIYALDVSVPDAPSLLWKKSFSDTGFAELGFTWSAPKVLTIPLDTDGAGVLDDDDNETILLFAAGYDPDVEDLDPATVTSVTSTAVASTSGTKTRSMGRGLFALDALTGDILWQTGPAASAPMEAHTYLSVTGMDFAIPSGITVIANRAGSVRNCGYVGDTGGNMWRLDFGDTDVTNWTVTKTASIADHTTLPAGYRKFLFPTDVVYDEDGIFDALLIRSGDREHPFDDDVVNRMYMFKDTGITTSAIRGTGATAPTITIPESAMFDATSNCIQDASACTGGDTPTSALADLATASGWYITLGTGEKVVGNAVTLNKVTFFNTNQPSTVASSGSCTSDLGVARQYKVLFDNAIAIADQNVDGSTDAADRSTVHAGGGYLPSPVPVVVEIDGEIHEGVISGVSVDKPPGSLLNARLRKFWYKEFE